MTAIRVREIAACRRSHECRVCGREIQVGDPCREISVYDEPAVRSEYSCCEMAWAIRTTSLTVLTAPHLGLSPTEYDY